MFLFIIFTFLFVIAVLVWFFFYAQPKPSPTLAGVNNPLVTKVFPKRFQFLLNNDEEPVSTSETTVTPEKLQALTKIWGAPATGQVFIDRDVVRQVDATSTQGTTTISIKKLVHATTTILMFVDRTSGHIFAYNRELNKTYQISNTTIPGVYDAYIFDGGTRVVFRYADTVKKTIVGVLATIPDVDEKSGAKPLISTTYLPAQVTSVAVNKRNTLLSYLVTGDAGASIYTVEKRGVTFVASTPFKEWSLSYGGDNLYATSKPSAYVEGQTVLLPTFEFIIGGKTGLMSNPTSGGVYINSMWSSQGLKTFISENGNQSVLPISTIASKCVWGVKNYLVCAVPKILPRSVEGLPDDWFQGRFTFEDHFFVIDPTTKESHVLYDFNTPDSLLFDVSSLSLSEDNNLIAFNRKQDASLWLLDSNYLGGE